MTKLIHFSDIHLWNSKDWDGDISIKRILGRINLLVNRAKHYPPDLGKKVVDTILDRDADAVIFTGDVSTASLISEFRSGWDLFAPLRDKWGDKFITIPGNHDRYTKNATQKRLFEKYFLQREVTYPFAVEIDNTVGLIGIETCGPRTITSRGSLTPRRIDQIIDLVESEKKKKEVVLVAGHYPLIYPPNKEASWQHTLPFRQILLKRLLEAGVTLYLHGHVHHRWVLQVSELNGNVTVSNYDQRSNESSGMLCLNAGSSGLEGSEPTRAAGFLEIVLDQGKVVSIESTIFRRGSEGLSTDSEVMSG